MESNWRWNVLEYGMQWSDWTLCARVPGVPTGLFIVQKNRSNAQGYIYRGDLVTGLPVLVATFTPTATHPHFPYGFLVLPD